jgi:NADH:ubiquinone oxidoreductase subunit 6 (subunit J)
MAKSPVRGAVGLLTTIIGIAGLFLLLSAQFLAAIQLIVYAGAVVVLFVFVLMLLGADAHAIREDRARVAKFVSGGLPYGAMTAAVVRSRRNDCCVARQKKIDAGRSIVSIQLCAESWCV